jgi:hypothetical protein
MDSEMTRRLDRLEAHTAISQLQARYVFAMDDHDLDAARALFTTDARVRSRDGVMDASGIEAVLAQYQQRFRALGPSNHVTHDHVIDFDEHDPDRASGRVSSHAELWRNGQMMVTALRYEDSYRREHGVWRFAERVLAFLYYIPVSDYGSILGESLRMRAYAEPQPADYPEALPGWRDYRR